jgi:hypothetical protein
MSLNSGKFRFVLKVVGVLAVVGVPLSVGFVVVRDLIREGGVGTPRTFETRNTVRKLALECMIEGVNFGNPEEPIGLPRSDIRGLYRWFQEQDEGKPPVYRRYLSLGADDREGTFRDAWGRELVYRFPSRRPQTVFELYSMGRNGVDDSGEGDDVTCGGKADFENWHSDLNWSVPDQRLVHTGDRSMK